MRRDEAMAITGAERRRLEEALVAAFPTEVALRQLSQYALDHPLERVTTASGLDARVFELLEWAAAQGRVDLLVKGAYELNPTNPLLVGFLRGLQPGWSFDLAEGAVDGGALPVGHVIDGWRIDRRLGVGAMGTVYAVRRKRGSEQALKVLHAPVEDGLDDPTFEEELAAAVALCAELNHGVARVQTGGVDVQLRRRWLVMDLVKGESLRRQVEGGRLSPDAALAVLAGVVEVLAEAHRHPKVIVHCDLKPENVFVHTTALGKAQVTVLDFGAARLVADSAGRRSALGTPLYAAPEQWDDGPVTPAADVWALGLLAFYMLTGADFWRASHVDRLVSESHHRDAVAASARAAEHGVALPESFDAWFARCVARAPSGRFGEARAAYEALAAVAAGWAARERPLPARDVVTVAARREELPEAATVARRPRDAGMTLARWLATKGAMAPQWVAWVLVTVADQLAVLRGIEGVHGTLEPDRIALDVDDAGAIVGARVVDLEARAVQSGRSTQRRTATMGLSRTTLRYASPRVLFEGASHDDPWSMAMIAYEALTGRVFVEGLSAAERVRGPGASARAAAQGVTLPTWFEAWFAQCVGEVRFEGAVPCGRAAWGAAEAPRGWHGEVMPAGVRRAEEWEHAGQKRYWCRGEGVGEVLMVWVPPGTFWRGSDDGGDDERPRHSCTITRGFYVGVFPVTVAEYQRVVKDVKGEPRKPVTNVSWREAQGFCEKTGFRLLTEAEWEYAARGSDGWKYPWGNEEPTSAHVQSGQAWTAGIYDVGTHPRGASLFGVQDMVGNIWEWCSDWYGAYAATSVSDPAGAILTRYRVARGGSWDATKWGARAASRYARDSGDRDALLGFRLSRGP